MRDGSAIYRLIDVIVHGMYYHSCSHVIGLWIPILSYHNID